MLGEKIKNLRQDSKLSQAQFAERIKISVSALYSYESERQTPSADVIKKICEEFKISADWLLELNLSQSDTPMTVASVFEIFRKLPEEAGFIKIINFNKNSYSLNSKDSVPIFLYISADRNLAMLAKNYLDVKKLSEKVDGVVDVVSPWLKDSLGKNTMKINGDFENGKIKAVFLAELGTLDFI